MPSLPWTLPYAGPGETEFGDLVYVSDHEQSGVDLLLEQFRGLPRIEGLLRSYLIQVQQLEDALWEILGSSILDNASDAQLDGIGDLMGEPRRGRSDALYRPAIRVRALINRCNGKHSEILAILTLHLGVASGAGTVELREPAPAALSLNVYSVPSSASELRVIARTVKPAGVNLDARVETSATRPARFGWDSGTIAGQTASNGFGWDGDASVGGLFATEI